MPTKKQQNKILKRRICSIARISACTSFLALAIIAISSLVRAMSLENIASENGIPASWEIASLGNPDTITIPITYWDQRQDNCNAAGRQFEWSYCSISSSVAQQGIVQDTLGADGFPVPVYTSAEESAAAGIHITSQNVTGHNPVQPTDNFYRWFHETDRSKAFNREVTFTRVGNNTYTYGGSGIFPLDNVDFSAQDSATKSGHNYHFTAHLQISMKIAADGQEKFEFSGDDDVWVYLNGKLVLDIGGLHSKLGGWFIVNPNGTITTYVDTVGQKTISTDISAGDVVNLDFFYAERSTSESNTKITISNMNWPISADSNLDSSIVGKIADNDSNLIEYEASIHNRDPQNPLTLTRLAAYIKEEYESTDEEGNPTTVTNSGFLPLDIKTLYYTTAPSDQESWQPIDITPPLNTQEGFKLKEPITMAPDGQSGDELYFRYFAETSSLSGTMSSLVSFYTELNGESGVTYDKSSVSYIIPEKPVITHTLTIKYLYEDGSQASEPVTEIYEPDTEFEFESPVIENYTPDYAKISGTITDQDLTYIITYTSVSKPVVPTPTPTPEPTPITPTPAPDPHPTDPTPTPSEGPSIPTPPIDTSTLPELPITSDFDDELVYMAPLGAVAFVPSSGVISTSGSEIFELEFANAVMSQSSVLVVLAIFASSFAIYFTFRKHLRLATAARIPRRRVPKMNPTSYSKTIKNRSVKSSASTTKTSRHATSKTTSTKKTTARTKPTKKSSKK